MKSEERHELQRNDLASGLSDLPGLWRRHGNKLLIVLTAFFLVLAAVRYKRATEANRDAETKQALAQAWAGLGQLPQLAGGPPTAELLKIRAGIESEINQSVQKVVDDSKATPTQAAWAWVARGEMYWAFAHAPQPAPTTQSSTQPAATQSAASSTTAPASQTPTSQPVVNFDKSAREYLDLSANAYREVVTRYPNEPTAAVIARFALAAIAEEKRDFAAAREQYKALIETPNFTTATTSPSQPTAKSMAEARLEMLNALEKPILLLPATQPVGPKPGDELMSGLGSDFQFGPMPSANTSAASPSAALPATQPVATPSATTRPQ